MTFEALNFGLLFGLLGFEFVDLQVKFVYLIQLLFLDLALFFSSALVTRRLRPRFFLSQLLQSLLQLRLQGRNFRFLELDRLFLFIAPLHKVVVESSRLRVWVLLLGGLTKLHECGYGVLLVVRFLKAVLFVFLRAFFLFLGAVTILIVVLFVLLVVTTAKETLFLLVELFVEKTELFLLLRQKVKFACHLILIILNDFKI